MVDVEIRRKLREEAINSPAVATHARALEPTAEITKATDLPCQNIEFRHDDYASLMTKRSMRTVGTKATAKSNASERLHFKEEIPEFEVNHEQENKVMTGALNQFNTLFACINGKGILVRKGRTRSKCGKEKNEMVQVFQCSCDPNIQFKYVHKVESNVMVRVDEKKLFVCKAYTLKGNYLLVRGHFTLKTAKRGIHSAVETLTDGGLSTGKGVETAEISVAKRKMAPCTDKDSAMQLSVKKHDGKKAKIVTRRISLESSILSRPERGGSKISTRIMPTCYEETFGAMQQSATLEEEEEEEGSTEPAINKEIILHKVRGVRKSTKEKLQKGKGLTRTKSKNNVSTAVNHNREVSHRVEKISDGSPIVLNDSIINTVRTKEIDLSRGSETAAVERIHEEEEGVEKGNMMSSLVSQGGHEEPERLDEIFHRTNTTKNQYTESETLARSSTSRKEATETFDDVLCEDSTGTKLPSGKGAYNGLKIYCIPPLLILNKNNSKFCNVGCVCKIYLNGKGAAVGQTASSSEKIECTESYIKK
jgi:hypothetical protein